MSNWIINYHQALQLRLLGMTVLLGALVVSIALGRGLRIVHRYFTRRTPNGIPICQQHTL